MALPLLTDHQRAVSEGPLERKLFLHGSAGTGKTTAAIARLRHMLEAGVSARSLLVFVPQRTLADGYTEALRQPTVAAGAQVAVFTIGGLAQRMVDLFWPLIAEEAGFAHPERPPVFLSLETAQYYMARLVRPLLDVGYFESVVLDRNRLYTQILDNLNKAAVVGFPITEIGPRLKQAWGGEGSQRHIYDEAQACATRFRRYCLDHNVLDFSLQLEVFLQHLWPLPLCRNYLLRAYTDLIADNVEEDVPVAHDLLGEWLRQSRSALVIADSDGGYRRFLGADPEGGLALQTACDETVIFDTPFTTSPALRALARGFGRAMRRSPDLPVEKERGDLREAIASMYHRYHPQMLDWVADQITDLVQGQGVAPGEIAVLAPFLTDSLRFALAERLERRGVPTRSHRPSRALRAEPATRCLLTLAVLAHPYWAICPSRYEVAYALVQAIEDMDLVRAQLLAQIVYRIHDGRPQLGAFERIQTDMQERLTFVLGERYDRLRAWLGAYAERDQEDGTFDHFLGRLFGEVLSQPGYGFHRDYDAGAVAANLIDSVRNFRWMRTFTDRNDEPAPETPLGQEYIRMVEDGVIAAQYVRSWWQQPEDAVLLAPAYTFLVGNRPVDYQFWLNVGSTNWWERLDQPLTHAYVLTRRRAADAVWTDADEVATRDEALYRLVLGLIRRCRRRIYLGLSELSEHGSEETGTLLRVFQRVLRDAAAEARP